MTTSENLHSQGNSYAPSSNKFDVNDIVMHFGREYYTTLSCHPERLHCFYGKQSSLLHCQEEDTEAAVCVGLEEIHGRISAMGYNGTRVVIGNIDCQPSMNGGILIFVLGTMHWASGIAHKFAQTFLLAEQPNGYFVLNDVMRILSGTEPKTVKSESKPIKKEGLAITSPAIVTKPVESTTNTPKLVPSEQPNMLEPSRRTNSESKAVETKVQSSETNTDRPKIVKKTSPQTPKKEESSPSATTPSSWASLAAGQKNRWQSGIVAESKGPVASIPIESKENGGRVNYRTNGDRRRNTENQPQIYSRDEKSDLREKYERYERNETNNERQYRTDYDASKSIYVSQVRGNVRRDALRKLFEQFGEIKHYEVVTTKGMAFIEFASEESQRAALSATLMFNDEPIKVEPRRPAPAKGREFGGNVRFPNKTNVRE